MAVKILYCAFAILAFPIIINAAPTIIDAINKDDDMDDFIIFDDDGNFILNSTCEEQNRVLKEYLDDVIFVKIKPRSTKRRDLEDRCLLPKEVGKGYEKKERFYYDVDEKRCRCFIYNGRGGNGNRFRTAEQCVDMCPSNRRASSINCSRN